MLLVSTGFREEMHEEYKLFWQASVQEARALEVVQECWNERYRLVDKLIFDT